METSSIVIVLLSFAVSFGVGRTIHHFRTKRRLKLLHEKQVKAARDKPPEAESKNKSKRKRQLQQQRDK